MNRKQESKPKWVKTNPKAQAPRKLAVHVEIYPRRRTTRLMKHSHARTNNKREPQQPVFWSKQQQQQEIGYRGKTKQKRRELEGGLRML